MGDRACIVLKDKYDKVCLYTHWSGHCLPQKLHAAMVRGRDRWDDLPYLARIVFSEMIKNNLDSITGYGISGHIQDYDEKQVITLNIDNKTVKFLGKRPISFQAFTDKDKVNW